MFKRVLVANRGEIARRVIRACRELGIESVAVYSEADKDFAYLKEATEAVCIGPAPATLSYLNQDALLKAATQTECQALHPGYGFLAENAMFATRCGLQKLTFIGPKPYQIRMMGDKATARETMKRAGLAVTVGSASTLASQDELLEVARQIGYPLLLKATAGGGGKGMRLVERAEQLLPSFKEAQGEALKSFGNDGVYLERFIVGARHIEFQILADAYGKVLHLGERECSIQRKHQKLLEESPASGFDAAKRLRVGAQLCEALAKIGYLGAGTVEFLMDSSGELYFMEMNTRIQVEHPVTELVTGVDLVAWQIRIAAGEHLSLSQEDIRWNGQAIECRINAEDPYDGFKPNPGVVTKLQVPENAPAGPVRFDSHLAQGSRISSHYDSMIGKLIVHADSRSNAIALMRKTLDEVIVEGVQTTLPLHRAILKNAEFASGSYDCRFLEDKLTWPS
jgi:acetyl-CoA carboxylase biotin carboxylase subunit